MPKIISEQKTLSPFPRYAPMLSESDSPERRAKSLLAMVAALLAVLLMWARPATAQERPTVSDAADIGRPFETRLVDESYELDDQQKSNLLRLKVLTYLGFLAVGTCIGSFLNVVIYRLPNNRSVVGKSKCPKCDEPIQWRYNLPVIGWLRLKGRCASCQVWIPMRYPAVEAIVGGLFVLLLAFELLPGGSNLPVRTPNQYVGVVWIIWYAKWDLIGIYLFHCCLGCVLIAGALIQWDGHPLPKKLIVFSIGVGIVAPFLWQHLHPVGAYEPRPDWMIKNWRWKTEFTDPVTGWPQNFGIGFDGLLDSLAGLVAGLLVGWLIARCLGPRATEDDSSGAHRNSFMWMFAIATTFLGWQMIGPLSILASVVAVVLNFAVGLTGDRRFSNRGSHAAVAVSVIAVLPFWRALGKFDWFPDHTGWQLLSGQGWWPLKSLEPYASILLAVAVACLIAMTHLLLARLCSNKDAAVPAG